MLRSCVRLWTQFALLAPCLVTPDGSCCLQGLVPQHPVNSCPIGPEALCFCKSAVTANCRMMPYQFKGKVGLQRLQYMRCFHRHVSCGVHRSMLPSAAAVRETEALGSSGESPSEHRAHLQVNLHTPLLTPLLAPLLSPLLTASCGRLQLLLRLCTALTQSHHLD